MPRPTRVALLITLPLVLVSFYFFYSIELHVLLPTLTDASTRHRVVTGLSSILAGKYRAVHHSLHEYDHYTTEPYTGDRQAFTRHIVAVGDLHGDLPNAKRVLKFSGVTDAYGNWTGDVDFFVQTGDIIDRGDDTIALFFLMDRLRAQAHAVGGTVLSHLGNHEWMNAIGDWRYVYPTEIKTFGSIAARQKMISTGRIGRSWAGNYTTASRLPLHPSIGPPNTPYPPKSMKLHYHKQSDDLAIHHYYDHDKPLSHSALSFVHGGLSPTYKGLTPFPTKINQLSESLLQKLQHRVQPPPHPPNSYPGLPVGTTPEEAALYDANGPLWYRGWAMDSEKKVCAQVDKVLAQTGTRRMIMGHTPDFKNIVARCNGKIIIIDTGISHAYGGVLSALSIHYTLTPIGDDSDQRWIEKEVVSAIYADRQEVLIRDTREVVGDFSL
ncbi:Metallo-dependent phosphatase-like protein [Crucibulum laeve]|uniref:Metallo-dependent phosphatase-like protein n=1 Tax=Crucibulum laeve TaxID=68775 RepID=A0A5C3M6W4_9AGAR|nr:Metallo-dependent phosphatase-like protein [Crucibulum laeve]